MLLDILISWDMDQIYMNRVKNIPKTFTKSFIKNQSAMEYLMTYGWSILIIAVVLGALSFLGIFNPVTFAPKATAGGCQVVKNSELGISNLEGSCNNQAPQYVGFSKNGFIHSNSYLPKLNQFTLIGWINYKLPPTSQQEPTGVVALGQCGTNVYRNSKNFSLGFTTCGCDYVSSGLGVGCSDNAFIHGLQYGRWYMVAITVANTGNVTTFLFQSGKLTVSTSQIAPVYAPPDQADIGIVYDDPGRLLNGSIANVQIYNISLTNSSVQALYREGIGGVPIDPQHLVAWYPLNGNANDYSGNRYYGIPINISYTSSWFGGYTQP
jgi:hypothetical protein